MPFYGLIKSTLHVRLRNATSVCSVCFIKYKNAFEKGEVGQAGEKSDRTRAEVGQNLFFRCQTVSDSELADPEASQEVQAGADRVVTV